MASTPWWKDAVCYQVWPSSFKDSNGDGLGDIPGIIEKLDHIKDLGVDCIWLSPFYASPMVDQGYDISNYEDVYPPFGTLQDVDDLIREIHKRGMKIIFDLIINHTSDKHAWFEESRRSRDNPKADWYTWRDSKIVDGKKEPPTNWGANFGGRAWTYNSARDQWYLHLFEPEMPDLNWENPKTRKAIYDSAIRFWLDKGVDGFRCDVANLYSKDQRFRDEPVTNPEISTPFPKSSVLNGPRIHEFWQEMARDVFSKYGDVMLIGETAGTSVDEILKYVKDARELSMLFDFEVFVLGRALGEKLHMYKGYTLPQFKDAVTKTQRVLSEQDGRAWVSVWLEDHDAPRSLTRFGTEDPRYRERATKLLAILIMTCSGTPFVYQGQEMGMSNFPLEWSKDDLRDVAAKNYLEWIEEHYPGDKKMYQKAWASERLLGRDNARTPVQWNGDKHAGFTTGEPWMRVNDNYHEINAVKQAGVVDFWKKMIKLRKEYPDLFTHGYFHVLDQKNEKTFKYRKTARDGRRALVVLNMSDEEADPDVLADEDINALRLLVSNAEEPGGRLLPWEGRVYLYE